MYYASHITNSTRTATVYCDAGQVHLSAYDYNRVPSNPPSEMGTKTNHTILMPSPIITNHCNQGYLTSQNMIEHLRTEVLSMNERRLVHRKMIDHLIYLSMMLILVSNDINLNPGPEPTTVIVNDTIYPCGTCDKPVIDGERGIVCDTCSQWYHTSCQSMDTALYQAHQNDQAMAWDCIICNCFNYTTSFSSQATTSNQFSLLHSYTSPN